MSTDSQPSTQRSAAAPDPQLDAPPPQPAPVTPPPEPQPGPAVPPPLPQHKIRPTRLSGLWFAVVFFAVVLLFLLIFILQNGRAVDVSYLGMHGHLPLGVAMLLSAVCGVLLTILAGAARISQLHAVARRHRRADARRSAPAPRAPADPAAR
ncbi:MAG TPA: lipopolysaccharide assembly protein LapA domain-containing protein [Streptosporangiaceae bacterium]|nr:lipopolysaccharide assembly protein LapA domain-containing protein [Streptosporangiaceae bacterium]